LINLKEHIVETIKLATPVTIGQVGIMMMGVVDSLMVGRLGASSLAAAALGNSLSMIIFIIGIGISFAVTPLVAISLGANKNHECGVYFRQSLIVNLSASVLIFAVIYFIAHLIKFMNQPNSVAAQAPSYTIILGASVIPLMLFQTYKQFIEGFSVMKPAMIITITANIINAGFNYLLIYGTFGFPKLGLDGAGWSTFVSRVFMACVLMFYVTLSKRFKDYDVNFHFKKLNMTIIRKILRLGLPSGFQYFFEVGAFAFAVIMIGWLGAKPLAAHQIAINLASISYMAVLGISAAGAIRVGRAVGMENVKEVRKAGFTAILLGAAFMTLMAVIFISLRNFLPALYISDKEVISIASSLLIIAGLFQIFDGIQGVGVGILRGLTDVKIPTAITFIAYWVLGLPIAYVLGFSFKLGVQGVWIGLLIGLAASAVMLTLRFNRRSKQRISI
jgi:MATE family, multidrug efflux pump